jgi:Tol biopolymer transport system component
MEGRMRAILRPLMLILVAFIILVVARATFATTSPEALYRINVDGTNLTPLLADADYAYWGPAWSPDGTHIAFARFAPGRSSDLYLMRADGTQVTQLTNNGRSNYFPAWAPDGQWIAFLSQEGSNVDTAEIFTITVDTREEVQLTQNTAQEYGSSWSPDGRVIMFGSKRDGMWQIYTMQADGSNQLPLPVAAHGNAPVWAPDGQRITFISDRDGDDDVYIMETDGRNQQNLTQNAAWDDQPAWAADGRTIAFASDRHGAASIYTIDVATSEVTHLTSMSDFVAGFPSWSADHHHLVFQAQRVPQGWRAVLAHNVGAIMVAIVGAVALGWLAGRWWRQRRHG